MATGLYHHQDLGGKIHLRSRNNNDFNVRYPGIVRALTSMPDDTVIDGEVVALDEDGRPSFNMLQNYGSPGAIAFLHLRSVGIEGKKRDGRAVGEASRTDRRACPAGVG